MNREYGTVTLVDGDLAVLLSQTDDKLMSFGPKELMQSANFSALKVGSVVSFERDETGETDSLGRPPAKQVNFAFGNIVGLLAPRAKLGEQALNSRVAAGRRSVTADEATAGLLTIAAAIVISTCIVQISRDNATLPHDARIRIERGAAIIQNGLTYQFTPGDVVSFITTGN